ncbi:alpha-hydroxy-acid oxidizing protein [Shewanella sp. SM20]|uniref:alpha-hydroxy-acid oxidizing protein n=1 Tax=unclassified Shewanella TaxID=196818 RepID=UPI0021D8A145|nr:MULTISPECIES: alpha-hydroxy-acid oxidizing protein [unclassified Shewanella]MCU8071350.1 alpha-hydroxy-acid oxidizing protein [Shewanella sp. SM32]MCU8093592.1 alpha-hydroxy-acid oxidizing protein [Shewanella sp. SM20]
MDNKLDQNRREFLTKGAVLAAAASTLAMSVSSSTNAAGASVVTAAATADASEGPKAIMGYVKEPKNLKDVLSNARKIMDTCAACDLAGAGRCNGKGPCGESVPGMGGMRQSFVRNIEAFEGMSLNMRSLHNVTKPKMETELLGVKLTMPILTGITGGLTYNMGAANKLAFDGEVMTEEKYARGIIEGAANAGCLGWAADGIGDPLDTFKRRLEVVKEFKGRAVAQIKPRTQQEIFERIDIVQDAGAPFFAIDIDSAGRAARALPGKTVEPKDLKKLKEIVKYAKIPFMAKGVMTVEEALMCAEAGCGAIVVSNHGGRVLSSTPASMHVLPAIVKAVRDRGYKMPILVDSGVRDGGDVLKALACGAQAVLVGRPMLRASLGGGVKGVEMLFKRFQDELESSMVLTGTANVNNVDPSILIQEV